MSMTKDELLEILTSGLPDSDIKIDDLAGDCLLYTSPSPRD